MAGRQGFGERPEDDAVREGANERGEAEAISRGCGERAEGEAIDEGFVPSRDERRRRKSRGGLKPCRAANERANERSERSWLGVRDGIRNWLITAA